jgi:DNA-binding NarL/FixJ family response regulator
MCRALKVLCAAPDRARLSELKRAAVSVHWELVGGATSEDELVNQVDGSAPDVVVIDAGIGEGAAARVRERRPHARIIMVGGRLDGVESVSLDGVRDAILGAPPVGGPVRIYGA